MVKQPPAYTERYVEELIPTYMWQSVTVFLLGVFFALVAYTLSFSISFFLTALPFAVVAIFFAAKVESLRVQGRVSEALKASRKARATFGISLWIIIVSLGAAIVFYL